MEMSGVEYTVDYLMNEIEKETVFMDRSEGGVTFCGGEPLLHPDTLYELLTRCGELDIHRAVDTTLFAKPATVEKIMPETDLFLVDLKHMDSSKHQYYCGVPNELILSNLRMVAAAGKEISIRIPLIEGVNADTGNISRSAEYLSSLPGKPLTVHLLPYHDIAKGKHEKLGSVYNPGGITMSAPSEKVKLQCLEIFRSYGLEVTEGG